ncbi:HNH endonuclease [Patescibacteria group bacterium]|nr:HNH endonuclease [Patescibacteria group bacterium]MBU2219962.1 HNH endonuclease [Patescibacteria group bacterium]MBU2265265.1 HNH endonuclease [Patescibacteria group bacterium]
MAFSQETINQAWRKADGRCECSLNKCRHLSKCSKELDPQNKIEWKKWHAHHKVSPDAGGSDNLDNCQILCVECHENTDNYGNN